MAQPCPITSSLLDCTLGLPSPLRLLQEQNRTRKTENTCRRGALAIQDYPSNCLVLYRSANILSLWPFLLYSFIFKVFFLKKVGECTNKGL